MVSSLFLKRKASCSIALLWAGKQWRKRAKKIGIHALPSGMIVLWKESIHPFSATGLFSVRESEVWIFWIACFHFPVRKRSQNKRRRTKLSISMQVQAAGRPMPRKRIQITAPIARIPHMPAIVIIRGHKVSPAPRRAPART